MSRVIQPWRDGDERTHCTHCSCCGYLFRTIEIDAHVREAHLGGRDQEQKHLRLGARLLMLAFRMDNSEDVSVEELGQYALDMADWVAADNTRQKSVRGDGTFHPTGVLP